MTKVLIEFMWMEALAQPLAMLIVAVVSVVAWELIKFGWRRFVRWAWNLEDI